MVIAIAPQAVQNWRVLALAHPGLAIWSGFLVTSAQTDAFVCLMDALSIDKAAVIGGSAGALSALQMVVSHPDRVSALVVRQNIVLSAT